MSVSGSKIKQLRDRKELSQEELAESIGASQSSISAWERNQSQPRSHYLEKLAIELGVTVSTLWDDSSIPIFPEHGTPDRPINGNENTTHADELIMAQRKLIAKLEAENQTQHKTIATLKAKIAVIRKLK